MTMCYRYLYGRPKSECLPMTMCYRYLYGRPNVRRDLKGNYLLSVGDCPIWSNLF